MKKKGSGDERNAEGGFRIMLTLIEVLDDSG